MKFQRNWNLEKSSNAEEKDEDDDENSTISIFWSLLIALLAVGIFNLVYLNWNALPTALNISDEESHPNSFIAERARINLKELTDIGPRVGGSYENEVLAVEYLKRKIEEIRSKAHPTHKIEMEVQKAYGNLFVDIKDYPMTSIYRGLQNVVVKFTPAYEEPANFLLLNSHFDSVATSPGGGDDGAQLVIMLEIMRKMSLQQTSFKHGIIFLFNGFEENTLQGSHGFITGHNWFKSVRAFINMDAASTGGREIMFQAGPGFPFLMRYYSKYIQRPFCNVIAEELFQLKLIPSETDYENFATFGEKPGMDFAHASYGYLYHTKYDNLENSPAETLQHTGDNILALTKAFADSEELDDIESHREGKAVFFDFMNWFMVYYTETVSAIIHCLMIALGIALLVVSFIIISKQKGVDYSDILFEFGISVLIQIGATLIGIGLSILIAVILDAAGKSMVWFTSIWLIFGLYYCPFLISLCLAPVLYIKFRKLEFIELQTRVIIFLHAQYFIFIILLTITTAYAVRSGYVFFFSIIFYSLSTIFNIVIKFRKFHWIYVHLIVQLIPFVYYCSLVVSLYAVFVPMSGRGDSEVNPDIKIGLFSVFMGLFLFCFMTPCVALLRQPFYFIGCIVLFFFVTIIVMVTPVGFPYREATSPQRHYLYHMERTFYNFDGTVKKADSKIYMHPQDRHSAEFIMKEVPEMVDAELLGEECLKELYCGVALYQNNKHKQSNTSYWLPADKPYFATPTTFQLKKRQRLSSTVTSFQFSVKGTDHMGFYFSPIDGHSLVKWSFSDVVPKSGHQWNNQNVYYVNYVYGLDDSAYDFEVQIENPIGKPDTQPSFHFTVVAHYMHHGQDRTNDFNKFINNFPKYTHVVAYQSYLENWVF